MQIVVASCESISKTRGIPESQQHEMSAMFAACWQTNAAVCRNKIFKTNKWHGTLAPERWPFGGSSSNSICAAPVQQITLISMWLLGAFCFCLCKFCRENDLINATCSRVSVPADRVAISIRNRLLVESDHQSYSKSFVFKRADLLNSSVMDWSVTYRARDATVYWNALLLLLIIAHFL